MTKAARDDALNAGEKDVDVIIPLNLYSIFEESKDKMLVPMQLQFNIELKTNSSIRPMLLVVDVLSLIDSFYGLQN